MEYRNKDKKNPNLLHYVLGNNHRKSIMDLKKNNINKN